jgi:hypothetical protein
LAIIASTAVYLASRLIGLGTDILNSDGARWYRRSSNFLSALYNGNLIETYQHYQPGVTLMWIRSFVEDAVWRLQDLFGRSHWYMENYIYFSHIHTITKVFLTLILCILFIYQVILVKRLFGSKTAVIYSFLIAVEPYVIGIDRWFHLTSLESYLSFSAFLSILYWSRLRKEGKKSTKALIISGIFIGLSVLSKVTGIVTVVPIFAVIVHTHFSNIKNKLLKSLLADSGVFALSVLVAVFALFPALWQNSAFVIGRIVTAVTRASDLERSFSFANLFQDFLYYPRILLFKVSPVIILLLITGLFYGVKKKKVSISSELLHNLIYFSVFYLLLSVSSKKIDRYCLEFIFPVLLFVSVFISGLKKRLLAYILVAVTFVYTYMWMNNYPVFSGFYSPVFGGQEKAIKMGLYDNSGEYFAQAAFYLNRYEKVKVFIPDNFESFKFFSRNEMAMNPMEADYALISLDTERQVAPTYFCGPVEKAFGPRFEDPVVFIYRCSK